MVAILAVEGLTKRFGGLSALDQVSLDVEEGSVRAIIGPNGAGKSTLLNCLVGRLTPDSGTARFAERSLLGIRPHEISQAGVARVFQTPEIFADLTVRENVMVPALARREGKFALNAWRRMDAMGEVRDRADASLVEVGLEGKADVVAGTLSRGDKRRLELTMCLIQDPRLMLLDEPTAGMSRADTNETIELLTKIGRRGITTIIIEHDMRVVFSLAHRVTVMAQGKVIAEGEPDEIRGAPIVQEAYLGGAHP